MAALCRPALRASWCRAIPHSLSARAPPLCLTAPVPTHRPALIKEPQETRQPQETKKPQELKEPKRPKASKQPKADPPPQSDPPELSQIDDGTARIEFLRSQPLPRITTVVDHAGADRALDAMNAALLRNPDRVFAWDTETCDSYRDAAGRLVHGRVICATCYGGEDVDFGNGPNLWIDNDGPNEGLLLRFKAIFEDPACRKVFHNYSYDRHALKRTGIDVRGFYADTWHVARLIDSSLSSWEGRVSEKCKAKVERELLAENRLSAAMRGDMEDEAMHLGEGMGAAHILAALQAQANAQQPKNKKGISPLGVRRTPVVPEGEAPLAASLADGKAKKLGYSLKVLTSNMFAANSEEGERHFAKFEDVVGRGRGVEEVHRSIDRAVLERWIRYGCTDAWGTYNLHKQFHAELTSLPWVTEVHAARTLEDAERRVASGRDFGRPGVFGPDVLSTWTGDTMWDFIQAYWTPWGELLCDMEEVGVGVDLPMLETVMREAQVKAAEHEAKFKEWVRSHPGRDGQPLNPEGHLIAITSSMQLRQLLFGGALRRQSRRSKRAPPEPPQADADDVGALAEGNPDVLPVVRQFQADNTEGVIEPGKTKPKKKIDFALSSLRLTLAGTPLDIRENYSGSGFPSASGEVLDKMAGNPEQGNWGLAYTQLCPRIGEEAAKAACWGLHHLMTAQRVKRAITGNILPLLERTEVDGRIRTSILPDTATGRLVSRRPNLQNQPALSRDFLQIRRAFVPAPGCKFVVADYSQVELRVLAHITDCKALISKFLSGGDMHSETAAEMFPEVHEAVRLGVASMNGSGGLPSVKDLFPYQRSVAKVINFSIAYGKSPVSLAEDLQCSEQEAQKYMRAWYSNKIEVEKWKQSVFRHARIHKEAVSILGRRRKLPHITHPVAQFKNRSERAAANHCIQGSAADIVMMAMMGLSRQPELQQLGYKVILQIHDEFILEGPAEHADRAKSLVEQVMQSPFPPGFQFRVPLAVDATTADSWYDAKGAKVVGKDNGDSAKSNSQISEAETEGEEPELEAAQSRTEAELNCKFELEAAARGSLACIQFPARATMSMGGGYRTMSSGACAAALGPEELRHRLAVEAKAGRQLERSFFDATKSECQPDRTEQLWRLRKQGGNYGNGNFVVTT